MSTTDALAEACTRARAAWPDLEFSEQQFVRDLSALLGQLDDATLAALAIEDLYLARACLAGLPAAAEAFRTKYRPTIRSALGRVVAPADVDELEQQFLKEVLLGTENNPPKIATYAGRAPLDRWVAVASQRTALMSLRELKAETRARNAAAAEPSPGGDVHPEDALMKERYRGDFQRALAEALERLPDRDRLLLKLHLVNGVSVEKVGQMLSVSQPTASRWLAAAREAVREDMKKTLGARLGTTSGEVSSLAGMVASQLELSISMVLRTG